MSEEFKLYVPIEKIDTEKRTVAGWATTEEIDKQNEIVDYGGSKDAFNNWQGNIREMHEPKSVGKAIEILPNDDEKRIWVKAYISKGAEDTWQKVKEGVLTGFSIGGQTVHKTTQIIKDLDTGGSKTVNRITKYRLNELSLVDNPANPGCSFSLVKNIDGVSYQTEIVEDFKKVVVTEALDPLKAEVTEHREKADSLIRKVLDKDELERMGDDDFGIVRKSTRGNTITKERILPMPDKVHAVRALEIYKNYGLTPEEENLVHKKAEEILGAAYETYKSLNRGGEDKMSNEKIDKLTEIVGNLVKTVESLAKAFEGAYRPIPGTKEHPKDAETTPSLNESPAEKPGAADAVETQHAEGSYPYKDKDPEKAVKAADVATSDLKTQEGTVIETKVSSAEGKHVSETECKTQDPKGAYPAKGPIKADVIEEEHVEDKKEEEKEEEEVVAEKKVTKSDNSEKDLSKLENEVGSLRKRLDDVLGLLKKPMPRKIKIEKNLEDKVDTQESQLDKDVSIVNEWQKSGKPLTHDQERFKDQVINKMLSRKFS